MSKSSSHGFIRTFALLLYVLGAGLSHYPYSASAEPAPTSILTTNYDRRLNLQDEVRDIPVPSRIYDVGYMVYSKKFATLHGYPEKNIAELALDVDVLEFRMRSEGGFVGCYLNALLDNTIEAYLPQGNWVFRDGKVMRFPQKIDSFKKKNGYKDEYVDDPAEYEYVTQVRDPKAHKYSVAHYLVGKNSKVSVRLQEVNRDYFKDKIYLSFSITCTELSMQLLGESNPTLWVLKKPNAQPKPYDSKDYNVFSIPQSLAKRSISAMEEGREYFFLNAVK